MRETLFKKAKKLQEKIIFESQDDKCVRFRIAEIGKDIKEVRIGYDEYTLNHSCNCKNMAVSHPTNLCSHKLACLFWLVDRIKLDKDIEVI